jgi:hypothetical protein
MLLNAIIFGVGKLQDKCNIIIEKYFKKELDL